MRFDIAEVKRRLTSHEHALDQQAQTLRAKQGKHLRSSSSSGQANAGKEDITVSEEAAVKKLERVLTKESFLQMRILGK